MTTNKSALHLLVKCFPNVPPDLFKKHMVSGEPLEAAKVVARKLEEDIFLSFLFEPEVPSGQRIAVLDAMLEAG